MRRIILLMATIASINCHAQTHTVHGKVVDTNGDALEFANVVALQLPDSTYLQGVVTDGQGMFNMTLSPAQEHTVFRVSMIGYETAYVPTAKADSIILRETAQQLDGIVVKGKHSSFSHNGTNLVCNVSTTSLSNETNLTNLLGKLPGFYMQGDELKTTSTGSVKYYINNHPATDEEVKHIDVASIKNIELDLHPGSRFSGEVGTVVFIHTKKQLEGLSGVVNSYTQVNHRWTQGVDGEVSYRYKNFGITLGADYTVYQYKPRQENSFELLDGSNTWKVYSQDEKLKDRSILQTYKVALDYHVAEGHDLRLSYTAEPTDGKSHFKGGLAVSNAEGTTNENFDTRTDEDGEQHNVNFYYTGTINEHLSMELAADWLKKKSDSYEELEETERMTKITSEANNTLWGASPRIVYKTKGSQLEVGADWSKSKVYSRTNSNIEDVEHADNKMEETKKAAYADYGWTSANNAWNLSAGLRYEMTTRNYDDRNDDEPTEEYEYKTLLPSLSLSYTSGGWRHQLAYNSNIQYPTFSQIAAGDVYINRYNYSTSNPMLRRSVMHNINYELSYRWLYLSAGYTYTRYPILSVFEVEEYQDDYRVKVSPQNLKQMHGINLIANLSPRFGWYEPRLTLGYIQNFMSVQKDKDKAASTVTKPFAIVAFNNHINLPNQWMLNLDISYNGSGTGGYLEYTSSSSVNLSVQKYFFNKSLQVTLSCIDLFDDSTPRMTGVIQGVEVNSFSWMDTRSVRLNLSWHFNQHNSRDTRSSISSEINRL